MNTILSYPTLYFFNFIIWINQHCFESLDIESFFLLIVPLISSKGYDLELKDDLIRVITNTSNGKDDKFTRLSMYVIFYIFCFHF